MSMEEDLTTYIKDDPSTKVLINDNFYPLILPQSVAFPACVYTVTSNVHNNNLNKGVGGGLTSAVCQIDVYSNDYTEVRQVRESLRNLLDGVNHTTLGSGDTFFESILLDSDPVDMVEAKDSSQVNLFRIMMSFNVHYQMSVPTGLEI